MVIAGMRGHEDDVGGNDFFSVIWILSTCMQCFVHYALLAVKKGLFSMRFKWKFKKLLYIHFSLF